MRNQKRLSEEQFNFLLEENKGCWFVGFYLGLEVVGRISSVQESDIITFIDECGLARAVPYDQLTNFKILTIK